ncbi:MAG: hypothetical protein EBS78_11380 [Altererythrobacter sp.]|nr:hypothetical protein [Altererythrobacter sp.]
MVGEFTTKAGSAAEMGWVLADVAAVLGMGHARDWAKSLDDDEVNTVEIVDGNRGNPNQLVVTEPGLYKLLARSRKPEAKRFDRWVRHEVLPTIRKTGGYGITPQHGGDLAALVGDAVTSAIRPILAPVQQELQLQSERINRLEDALERPAWHQVCEAYDLTPFDCWLPVNTINKPPAQSGLYSIISNGQVVYVGKADGKLGLLGRLKPVQHDAMRYLWHAQQAYSVVVCPTAYGGNKLKNAERDLQTAVQPLWEYGGLQVKWARIQAALASSNGQMELL